jgi:hypothetical protein
MHIWHIMIRGFDFGRSSLTMDCLLILTRKIRVDHAGILQWALSILMAFKYAFVQMGI